MIVIGIDPGKGGAVAHHDGNGWVVQDCPTAQLKVNGKVKSVSSPELMAELLVSRFQGYEESDVHVFLERVHAMPKQGATSMFSFGENFGIWKGIVATMGFSLTLVTPQAWKKKLMAGMGKEKGASRVRAMQLFPDMREELKLKKHDGRAEALLIAEYGRRELGL